MTEEQFSLFTAYIKNELTPQEDAAIIELLNSNPSLMQEFELELTLKHDLHKHEILTNLSKSPMEGYESADEHIALVTKAIEDNVTEKENTFPLYKKYKPLLAAAALILFVLLVWLFFLRQPADNFADNNKNNLPVTVQPKLDSNHNTNGDQNIDAQKLFAENYTAYKGGSDDPVELNIFLSYYTEKKYKEVLNTKKEDYQTRGTGDTLLTLYIDFYKALSYLETKRASVATGLLNQVIKSKETSPQLLYNVQWFYAMAALRQNEITAAKNMFEKIQQQNKSPWQIHAAEMLRALKNNE